MTAALQIGYEAVNIVTDNVNPAPATQMTVLYTGNVGIGTTSPQATLQVARNVQVDGNIAAKYQDIAEWVSSDSAIDRGTVMIADSHGVGYVLLSSEAYNYSRRRCCV